MGFAAKALLAVSTTKESTVIDAKKRYMMRLPSINLSKKWIYLNFTLLECPLALRLMFGRLLWAGMPGWQNDRVENQANDDIPHDDHPSLVDHRMLKRASVSGWFRGRRKMASSCAKLGLHVLEESAGDGGR